MKVKGAELNQVKLTGGIWKEYQDLIFDTVIPYQWEILNDRIEGAEKSYTVRNFRIAAGELQGEHGGFVFQDSDLYKWLEAVGNMLQGRKAPDIEEKADWIIGLMEKAQQPDGYLNTYFQLKEPDKKWTNILECHELYCGGHLMEAAAAYTKGTGKETLLGIACKLADCICSKFGEEEGKLHGYPGHQEVEIGLQKLFEITGNLKYLRMAEYFLEERGKNDFFEQEFKKRGGISHWTNAVEEEPNRVYNQFSYKEYNQFHLPVWEQKKPVGHAVRGVYMYTAMAGLAGREGDERKLEVCRNIWKNIVNRQMYINGSIGSTPSGEAFTRDYDLPNDTNYSETCAALGLVFFSQELYQAEGKGCYGDVIENTLYNTVLAALGKDGKHFFYTNPMEMKPYFYKANPQRFHLKACRPKWHSCACCPPNIARTLGGLGKYILGENEDTVFIQMFAQCTGDFKGKGGNLHIQMETNYPWSGDVELEISGVGKSRIAIRIPGWCKDWKLCVNGRQREEICYEDGYAYLPYNGSGMRVGLHMEMMPVVLQSNPRIIYNLGKAAVMRGPILYCIEEKDNGKYLEELRIRRNPGIKIKEKKILGTGVRLQVEGVRKAGSEEDLRPYYTGQESSRETFLTAIPYFLWGNRGEGEMLVWILRE